MNASNVIVTNIQRFSLHDGPGIRTTVFLKGCSLRCPWCSNPENLTAEPQPYVKNGIAGIYGKYLNCEELHKEIMKDKDFYGSYTGNNLDSILGGVTFSGGEALLQIDKLDPLLKRLKEEHIHTAVETCLYAPVRLIEIALRYIDLFYVDIKILDSEICKSVLHGNFNLYLRNLDTLFLSGAPIVVRIPVIGGWTDGENNRQEVLKLLSRYRPIKVELIKEHHLGISKYESLSMPIPDYRGVSDGLMQEYYTDILKQGLNTEICKI